MRGVFFDTGYLLALINKKDNLHVLALEASGKFHGPYLTIQLILVELTNSLSLPEQRPLAVNIVEKLQKDPSTTVVPFSSERFEETLLYYKARSDKSWGMVDCFSFIVMDELMVKQALTFDEHFKQAGYNVPLL